MIIRDVRRNRRVGPSGHDDPQPGRRPGWQQRSDAVGVWAGGHAPVLIQAVYYQHQRPTFFGCLGEHAQQMRFAPVLRQVGRERLA